MRAGNAVDIRFVMMSLELFKPRSVLALAHFVPRCGELPLGSGCFAGFGGVHQTVSETVAAVEASLPGKLTQHGPEITVSWCSPRKC